MDVQVKTCGKPVQLGQGPNINCGDKWGQSIIQCEFCKGWTASRAAIQNEPSQFSDWFDETQSTAEHCGVSLGPVQFDQMELAWEASRRLLK